MLTSLLFALACTPTESGKDTTRPDDTAVDTAQDTDLPSGLSGTPPDSPVALPVFAAVNEHGEPRDQTFLQGHPTVRWFYPAAGTYG